MPSLTVQPVTMDRAPIYAVLFDGTLNPESYTPLVAAPYGPDAPFTIPHGLDHEVVAALPGLWYCLHLPNALFELIDIPPSGLVTMQSLDLGHHILLTPVAAFTAQYVGALLAQGVPVLAVCADELLAEATERCASLGFALQPAPYSQLCSESLKAHWRAIYELVETDEPYLDHPPYLSHDLKFAPADLPRRWLTRQLDDGEEVRAETCEPDQDMAIYRALNAQTLLGVAVQHEEDDDNGAEDAMLAEARERLRFPVSIAVPGVAATYVNNAYDAGLRAARAERPPRRRPIRGRQRQTVGTTRQPSYPQSGSSRPTAPSQGAALESRCRRSPLMHSACSLSSRSTCGRRDRGVAQWRDYSTALRTRPRTFGPRP